MSESKNILNVFKLKEWINKNYKSTAKLEILQNFQKLINRSTGKNYSKLIQTYFNIHIYMSVCIYVHTYRAMHQIQAIHDIFKNHRALKYDSLGIRMKSKWNKNNCNAVENVRLSKQLSLSCLCLKRRNMA